MKGDCEHTARKRAIEDAMIEKAEAKSHYVTLSEGGATANALRAAELEAKVAQLRAALGPTIELLELLTLAIAIREVGESTDDYQQKLLNISEEQIEKEITRLETLQKEQ